MRMKTFQADTMQEALARVKDEMGPDAVILKSRKSTRKLNGKTVPCFEVTAALEESLFARPEVQARSTAPAAAPAPERAVPGRPQPVRPEPSGAGVRSGRVPEERGTYDWKGSLRRVEEDGRPAGRTEPAPRQAAVPAGVVQENLLEQLRAELREVKDKVDMPTRELTALKQELRAMFESANARNPAPAPHASQLNHAALSQGASQAGAAPGGIADFASPASLPPGLRGLHAFLLEMDIDADLAAELAYASAGGRLPAAGRLPGGFGSSAPGGPAPDDMASVAGAMAARIRTTGGVRLRPGKPSVVALVGPTGAGKTTTLCKLAALAKLHQGKRVGILSADSFRMGANEQLELFGRTAGIPVRPLFSAADVGPALKEFAHCDLILVDTAGRSHAHPEAWVEMQSLLRAVRADEIHLVLSTTTRMREMIHQAGMYGGLCRLAPACGVVFTKLDECVSLGCVYNLARRLDAPVSYLCDGQVIPDHISLATPQSVAGKVLSPSKAAEEAAQAGRPEPVAR